MGKIIVSDLEKIYNQGKPNEIKALGPVSFEVEEGEFVVILGPSGAGKSTLLNILGGMDTPTSGTYEISGEDVSKFNEKQLTLFRRDKIGFVFQFYNLVTNLTALENVQLAGSVCEHQLDAKETLAKVGLGDRLNNFPSQLSGGEQQRTAIARALVKNPELLLCDEPTGALDSKTGGAVISLLKDVSKEFKKTVILVTHNAKIADVADRLIRISDGKIAYDGYNKNPVDPASIEW